MDLAGDLWEEEQDTGSAFPDAQMQGTMQVSHGEGIPLSPGSAVEKRRAGRGTPVLRLMLNLRGPKPEESLPTVPMVAVWYRSEM